MTKDELLISAIKNTMGTNQANIHRLEGENRGLAKVLGQLESSSDVAKEPSGAGAVGDGRAIGSVVTPQPSGAVGQHGSAGGGIGEGCAQGTDGGVT